MDHEDIKKEAKEITNAYKKLFEQITANSSSTNILSALVDVDTDSVQGSLEAVVAVLESLHSTLEVIGKDFERNAEKVGGDASEEIKGLNKVKTALKRLTPHRGRRELQIFDSVQDEVEDISYEVKEIMGKSERLAIEFPRAPRTVSLAARGNQANKIKGMIREIKELVGEDHRRLGEGENIDENILLNKREELSRALKEFKRDSEQDVALYDILQDSIMEREGQKKGMVALTNEFFQDLTGVTSSWRSLSRRGSVTNSIQSAGELLRKYSTMYLSSRYSLKYPNTAPGALSLGEEGTPNGGNILKRFSHSLLSAATQSERAVTSLLTNLVLQLPKWIPIVGVVLVILDKFMEASNRSAELNRNIAMIGGISDIPFPIHLDKDGKILDPRNYIDVQLGKVRNCFTSAAGLNYMIDSKEYLDTLGEIVEAGTTKRKLAEELELDPSSGLPQYRDVLERVITYASMFGTEVKELANQFGEWNGTLGESFTDIEKNFATSYGAAMKAEINPAEFQKNVHKLANSFALFSDKSNEFTYMLGELLTGKLISMEEADRILSGEISNVTSMPYSTRFMQANLLSDQEREIVFNKFKEYLDSKHEETLQEIQEANVGHRYKEATALSSKLAQDKRLENNLVGERFKNTAQFAVWMGYVSKMSPSFSIAVEKYAALKFSSFASRNKSLASSKFMYFEEASKRIGASEEMIESFKLEVTQYAEKNKISREKAYDYLSGIGIDKALNAVIEKSRKIDGNRLKAFNSAAGETRKNVMSLQKVVPMAIDSFLSRLIFSIDVIKNLTGAFADLVRGISKKGIGAYILRASRNAVTSMASGAVATVSGTLSHLWKQSNNVLTDWRNRGQALNWEQLVSGKFGAERQATNGSKEHKHQGIDLALSKGTEILSPKGIWKVESFEEYPEGSSNAYHRNAGKQVVISSLYVDGKKKLHPALMKFFHLDSVDTGLKKGQILTEGSKIGRVGNTGHHEGKGAGYHLHLELHVDDSPIDPQAQISYNNGPSALDQGSGGPGIFQISLSSLNMGLHGIYTQEVSKTPSHTQASATKTTASVLEITKSDSNIRHTIKKAVPHSDTKSTIGGLDQKKPTKKYKNKKLAQNKYIDQRLPKVEDKSVNNPTQDTSTRGEGTYSTSAYLGGQDEVKNSANPGQHFVDTIQESVTNLISTSIESNFQEAWTGWVQKNFRSMGPTGTKKVVYNYKYNVDVGSNFYSFFDFLVNNLYAHSPCIKVNMLDKVSQEQSNEQQRV